MTGVRILCFALVFAAEAAVLPAHAQENDRWARARACLVTVNVHADSLAASPVQSFFDKSTGRVFSRRAVRRVRALRHGSGIVVGSGLIAANHHLIGKADKATVILSDGRLMPAKTLYRAPEDDFVLLGVDPSILLVSLDLAPNNALHRGMRLYNLGASFPKKGKAVAGTLLNDLNIQKEETGSVLAAITFRSFRGDSGTPVLTEDGLLAGMIVAGFEKGPGVTYALPAEAIRQHLKRYRTSAVKTPEVVS